MRVMPSRKGILGVGFRVSEGLLQAINSRATSQNNRVLFFMQIFDFFILMFDNEIDCAPLGLWVGVLVLFHRALPYAID
jgi:hypothetical protein